MIVGTSCSTVDLALEEPDEFTPRSSSQLWALSAAALESAEIESFWE
jgi:hypothetical protein